LHVRCARGCASRLADLEYDWTGRVRAGYFLSLLLVSIGAPEYLGGCRRLRRSLWWPQPYRPRSTSRHRLSRGGVVLKPLGDDSTPLLATVLAVVVLSSSLWVMIRFGILPFTLVLLLQIVGSQAPLTSDLSAWYASKGLIVVALVLALAVWSFRHALGGRKVLQGDFLEH